MVRQPIVSGMFYPSDKEELNNQIKECFTSKFGPGKLPEKNGKNILGIIAPHAGYQFSGACAAHAFKELAECKPPDLFILLGLSHSGFGSCISLEDWKTPLGTVKTDAEFGKRLSENSNLTVDESSHSQEHSIEVQLPFLQFVLKDAIKRIKIAPIIVSHDINHEKIASDIIKTARQENKKIAVIASSDFTHYGFNYGYFPFSTNIKENMYALDKGAIDPILKLNSDRFLDYVNEKKATICGQIPIAVCIDLCKLLGAKKAGLLKYYTSGDIINDYSSAVGYASIVF